MDTSGGHDVFILSPVYGHRYLHITSGRNDRDPKWGTKKICRKYDMFMYYICIEAILVDRNEKFSTFGTGTLPPLVIYYLGLPF